MSKHLEWIRCQTELDDTLLQPGAVVSAPKRDVGHDCSYSDYWSVLDNGDDETPMIKSIGIDRFNRLWRQDDGKLTMIADFGGAFGPEQSS